MIKITAPGKLSAWVPEKDPVVLAFVGKMGEEAAELAKACARIAIAGVDTPDNDNPEQTNFDKLIEEYCDIMACYRVLQAVHAPALEITKVIPLRINAKEAHLLRWWQLLQVEVAKP